MVDKRMVSIILAGLRELQAAASGDIAKGVAAEMILAEHDIDNHSNKFAEELEELCEKINLGNIEIRRVTPSTMEERQRARGQYTNDEINVDEDAVCSHAEDGYWVSAWLWLAN